MLKTIVVPLDGSSLAERALSLATALSIPTAAHLVLVHVSATEPPSEEASPYGTYLDKMAADLRDRGFCVETVAVVGRHIPEAITAVAEQQSADLIVMTTHGRSGPARWVLGSVAETLVKSSRLPILLQRAWDPNRRAILLADQPRLLVTVDGSRFAEAALPAALTLADDLGAEVLLLRVEAGAPDILQSDEDVTAPGHTQAYQPMVADREYLTELAARLHAEWPNLTIDTRVECGDPATAIIAAAEDAGAALVVMATHGRTGFQRVALGSVADAVLQHGRAPLVLVHPASVADTHIELVAAEHS
jgi:nucleotide-binding universal stress UspA family protein